MARILQRVKRRRAHKKRGKCANPAIVPPPLQVVEEKSFDITTPT
jgi:hypothetical protein